MTYLYENLGPERFQQLCQAILATEYTDVQCLPVGQPDGGRDAFSLNELNETRPAEVVFQIKFSRNPSSKDERAAVEELIKSEAEKVEKLRHEGLKRYYLLTNVSGTSHLNAGSIDRVNAALTKRFGVPAYCWWRDDIDRRLDARSSIKWSYPDAIRGADLLQALYEGTFGGEESRRLNAIRAYLAHQYKYDSQLKFRQVDLEKGLVDLFVDVPAAALGASGEIEQEQRFESFRSSRALGALFRGSDGRPYEDSEDQIGAVCALADSDVANGLPRVVLEGAPGQGKSTVTQFLCQLHRMLLLDKAWDIKRVPETLRPSDVRLPLRVDLRDYATWLSGKSPFQDANPRSFSEAPTVSLESFLAAQISAQSGGLEFSPDDLLAFASNSAILVVLDGFDEVADIGVRNKLVKEVSDASNRFEGNSISSQFIVTSRPAAFANSPGFPRDEWQYVEILPLTRSAISIYTDKWTAGHNLPLREKRDITAVLEEKLEYPHVRELARNPMQLAILLALISTQGASLPDKRTTLYDRYIDIFFNREAEKSKVVRDKRDLLIDMHRFLAWRLQVEAESDAKAGNISEERLREVLRTYLSDLGHDPQLVDDLFVGMVERVVALVSRVQGTFEFEVQPLREYFAARYLYDTAPYIQVGSDRSGSIMDRFDALARNAYWLNVTRFYCGCYSTGELPSLVDGLISIGQSDLFEGTPYLYDLVLTLLGDFVFSQQPKSIARLTDFFFEETRFRGYLGSIYLERRRTPVSLPEECGRRRLFDAALNAFKLSKGIDTAYASASVLKANLGQVEPIEIWRDTEWDFPEEEALLFLSHLDVIEVIDINQLLEFVKVGGDDALRASVYRDRVDVLEADPSHWPRFVRMCLDGDSNWFGFSKTGSEIERYKNTSANIIFSLLFAMFALQHDEGNTKGRMLIEVASRYHVRPDLSDLAIIGEQLGEVEDGPFGSSTLSSAISLLESRIERIPEFTKALCSFFAEITDEFGYRPLLISAAVGSLRWVGHSKEGSELTGLLGTLADIQGNSGKAGWWKSKLSAQVRAEDRPLLVMSYLFWINRPEFLESVEEFSAFVDSTPIEEIHVVYRSFFSPAHPYQSFQREDLVCDFDKELCKHISPRTASLIYPILADEDQESLFENVLSDYFGDDEIINEVKATAAWIYASSHPESYTSAFAAIAKVYSDGNPMSLTSSSRSGTLPGFAAQQVLREPEDYPLSLWAIAERTIADELRDSITPVGNVADENQWFLE